MFIKLLFLCLFSSLIVNGVHSHWSRPHWYIQNPKTKLVLDASEEHVKAKPKNTKNVMQLWRFECTLEGTIRISNKGNGKSLEVEKPEQCPQEAKVKTGMKDLRALHQSWIFREDKTIARGDNCDRVLDISKKDNSNTIITWPRNNASHQKFEMVSDSRIREVFPLNTYHVYIQNPKTRWVLDASDEKQVKAEKMDENNKNQRWYFSCILNGKVRIHNVGNGKVLEVDVSEKCPNGAIVRTGEKNVTAANQSWKINPDNTIATGDGCDKVLDISQKNAKRLLVTWEKNKLDHQKFQVILA